MPAVDKVYCGEILIQLFMSLLGAAAYALLTRTDAAVYIVALQRHNMKPQRIHIKRLNRIVRWIQKDQQKVIFTRIQGPTYLRLVSDAAFRKEDDTGHALKGHLFLRAKLTVGEDSNIQCITTSVHILDSTDSKQKHVTRSTFGAELFSACECVDHGMQLVQILHELELGSCSHASARQLREEAKWSVRMALTIDAYSVFSAITAQHVKEPAEKALWNYVQYVRELLDEGILEILTWSDTRDMTADGLTKGTVDRNVLLKIGNEGKWLLTGDRPSVYQTTRKSGGP